MKRIVNIYENKSFETIQPFSSRFKINKLKIERTRQMTGQEDNVNLGKTVCDDNNHDKKSWVCLRSLIVFLSQLFVILVIILGCFSQIHLSKFCDESTV